MTALIIANPQATAFAPEVRNSLVRTLRDLYPVEVVETSKRGDATDLAATAMRERSAGVIIGLGGDGTHNEIVNGLLSDGVQAEMPVLGLVPAGATNVFARSLGFPNDLRKSVPLLREYLQSGQFRRISVGQVNQRYFTFSAGIGFDAAIIEAVEEYRARGKRSTLLLTLTITARHLFLRRWPGLRFQVSGRPPVEGLRWMIVANSDPWTFLNSRPLRPTPQASFDLGMDVYALTRMAPLGLLRAAVQMYRRPSGRPRADIHLEHDVGEFDVMAEEPVPVHVDGDLLGRRQHLTFRSVPEALCVAAPASVLRRRLQT